MHTTFGNGHSGVPPVHALVARGGALRTFGGLAFLLTVALFVLGAYLIADQFTNPLATQSLGLFVAAFVLATAMVLLSQLMQLPRRIWRKEGRSKAWRGRFAGYRTTRSAKRPVLARARAPQRTNLPYQRCYVDRVRVRA